MAEVEMKLHRLSRVKLPTGEKSLDSVKRSKAINSNERSRGQEILMEAQGYYSSGYRFRNERERNKRYTYGDQWGDVVCVDGKMMTEEEYIKMQGQVPLKNNLIRRLVRNVIGSYVNQGTEPRSSARDRDEQPQAETLNTLLEYVMQVNEMDEMYSHAMREFLISGMPVMRKWYGWNTALQKEDCWTSSVSPAMFVPDSNMRDPRGWDCQFVGEIHDVSRNELMTQFAKTPAEYKRLDEIYSYVREVRSGNMTFEEFGFSDGAASADFLLPQDTTLCRVIEVWRKESKPRYRCHDWNTGELFLCDPKDYDTMVAAENAKRQAMAMRNGIPEEEIPYITAEWFMDSYWCYYYLSPFGDILAEGETPYKHKSHPYVFKPYPFVDGEIHSFVEDVIDPQRYINRNFITLDWIWRASAKGVLMIPEDCLNGQDPQDFADQWARFNGVIVYKPSKSGAVPSQISANSANVGIYEFLNYQLKSMEDISGVSAALQGKGSFAGESGSHAQMMIQQAATSLVDLFRSFNSFVIEGTRKDLKNIQQFYDEKRIRQIVGDKGVDLKGIKDLDFDVSVVQSPSSQQYKAWANDFLINLYNSKAFDIKTLLRVAKDLPYADALLQQLESQEAQMAQGQMPDSVSPEIMQQIQQQSNPQAMAMLQQAMGGQQAA